VLPPSQAATCRSASFVVAHGLQRPPGAAFGAAFGVAFTEGDEHAGR
jgi:hypothetical protein